MVLFDNKIMKEQVMIDLTVQHEGKKDIRVQLTLSIEDDELKDITFKKLLTVQEMN